MSAEQENDAIDIFRRLRDSLQISVRHGRARLTISRSGEMSEGDLGPAIKRFEKGEIDAEDLAWAFVRTRVVKHTPSFAWDGAELLLLLDRVVGVSTEPTFESSAPDDVAEVLVDKAREAREARERMRRSNEGLARDISDRFGGAGLRPIVPSMKNMLGTSFTTELRILDILGTKSKLSSSMLDVQRPAMLEASEMAQKHLLRAGRFDILGKSGKNRFDELLPKDFAADLFGLRRSPYPKMFDNAAFSLRLGEIVGLDKGRGLSDFSAAASFSKMLRHDGKLLGFRGLGDQLARINRDWIERLKESYPPNWRDLDRDELDSAEELMLDGGPSLAWVPRLEILREILAADDEAARAGVLLVRSDEILEDIESVLGEVESPDLVPVIQAASEAIEAHRDGYTKPGLALASVLVSDIAHNYFGYRNFAPVRKEFRDVDTREVDIREYSYQVI
ncbi:MAG TPA: hypothetical protein VG944_13865, partial [Fimbriimonas sp.]|nr:hypothetical protein [Fimbriimonas sp.]